MMKIKIVILIFFALISCEKLNEEKTEDTSNSNFVSATVPYKMMDDTNEDLLSLDIYYDADVSKKKPVVIYVHGGGWSTGDKANNMSNKIDLFEQLDYVLVSINYRLSPLPSQSTIDRIKYPIHNIDVADAIKWVIENIDNYGGKADKIGLLGHSAGAHLVSLTGTNSTFIEQTGYNLSYIKGVASIDTEGYNVRDKVLEGNILYINAFGNNEQENIEASPIFNVTPNSNNPKFFVAKRGESDRIQVANQFIQTLIESGVEIVQVDGSTYSHSGINEAIGEPGETVITPALIEFFQDCFK